MVTFWQTGLKQLTNHWTGGPLVVFLFLDKSRFIHKKNIIQQLIHFNWTLWSSFHLQDKLGGGFQRFQSFSGQVSWLNIWDYVLDDAAIRRISECGDDLSNFKGNILAWNPSEWVRNGKVNITTINDKDLCDDPLEKNYIIIPQQQSVKVSRKICEKLGKKTWNSWGSFTLTMWWLWQQLVFFTKIVLT